MNILLSFGSSDQLYVFPADAQINYFDDFDRRGNKLIKMAGSNSRFSQGGTGRGQSDGGQVRIELWLEFDSLSDVTDKINSIRQIGEWGLMPLWRQPSAGAPQFCWAMLNSEALNQDVHNVPHLRQRIPLVFDVPDPFWYAAGSERLWGDGGLWNDGGSWGESTTAPAPTTITNTGTLSLTVGGTAYTFARLEIANNSGADAGDITIQRIENGAVADQIHWTGTLADGEQLHIDPRSQRVQRGPTGADVISLFTAQHPDWMRLLPGTNTLNVFMAGEADVSARWMERYI